MSGRSRAASITFKGQIAGSLEETAAGGTRFIYHEEWREIIACCFPVDRREHEWATGLHPFFQHLGPEGWLREKQARFAHIAEEDDFGLLLRYGADCIGAVGVMPVAEGTAPVLASSDVTTSARTISGVQKKLLVGQTDIAKFNSLALPTLVRNEYLSLTWMVAILGQDEVTAFQRGQVAGYDEEALIVTRFDRTADGQRLRAEDFAQILCKPRGADSNGKYESSYEEAASVIRDYSVRPEIDLIRFFRRLILFAVVGNADAHLKNFSLLERPEGLRLSPVYDVVNVGVCPELDQRFALTIDGEKVAMETISRPLLSALGKRIGLPQAAIEGAFSDLKRKSKQAEKRLPQVRDEGRDPFGVSYAETVRNGCRRLLDE